MALFFLDTSAIAKRYVTEPGSTWTDSLWRSQQIVVSSIALVEIAVFAARREREGALTSQQRREIVASFLSDIDSIDVVDLRRELIDATVRLVASVPRGIPLRSLDAVQLGSAVDASTNARAAGVSVGAFVTADTRLLAAARALGLPTDDPNLHP